MLELFEKHLLFRRIMLAVLVVLTAWVSNESVRYAFEALRLSADWTGTVAILGAIQTPILGLTGWAFKLYLQSRKQ